MNIEHSLHFQRIKQLLEKEYKNHPIIDDFILLTKDIVTTDHTAKEAYKKGFKSGLLQTVKMPKFHPGGAFNPRNWAIASFDMSIQMEIQAEAAYQDEISKIDAPSTT